MNFNDNSAAMDAFKVMCDELERSELMNTDECQYWVFERGYRSAIQNLIEIMETGVQAKKFGSPKLRALADKLLS